MDATTKHQILKCTGGTCEERQDLVAVERKLRVKVNGQEVLSLFCTPLMVRELVVGFLLTEGVADGVCTERMSIMYGEEEVEVEVHAEGKVRAGGGTITSGCVGGVTFQKKMSGEALNDPFSITSGDLKELFRRFQKLSQLYDSTGCIHSAAISDGEDILCFAEDIGRHNAVDKAIGYTILEGLEFSGKLMLASGRLSSEIVSKCAKWGIPMVASRTAPTALSLKIAEENGVTVVGFVRGDRMNVYTHPKRLVLEG